PDADAEGRLSAANVLRRGAGLVGGGDGVAFAVVAGVSEGRPITEGAEGFAGVGGGGRQNHHAHGQCDQGGAKFAHTKHPAAFRYVSTRRKTSRVPGTGGRNAVVVKPSAEL